MSLFYIIVLFYFIHLTKEGFSIMEKICRTRLFAGLLLICVISLVVLNGCAATISALGPLPPPEPVTSFVDSRDGQTYRAVRIGRLTWMAQNLNFVTNDGSSCLEDKPENCEKFGRLYDWDAAMNACPAGWRLPDTSEWSYLIGIAGGTINAGRNLKSTSVWTNYMSQDVRNNNKGFEGTGIDYFGFATLPGGLRYGSAILGAIDTRIGRAMDASSGRPAGQNGFWWSATESSKKPNQAYIYAMSNLVTAFGGPGRHPKNYGYSIRCVRNDILPPPASSPEHRVADPITEVKTADTYIDEHPPKTAVYVTGSISNIERRMLGNILTSLINDGRYTDTEDHDDFLARIDESGVLDTNQIYESAKESGAQFVCIAVVTPTESDSFLVSARIVDLETKEVIFADEAATPLRSVADLTEVSNTIVTNMLGEPPPFVSEPPRVSQPVSAPPSAPVAPSASWMPPEESAHMGAAQAHQPVHGPSADWPRSPAGAGVMVSNFTTGERIGTGALNLLVPGVGSAVIMRDWTGAGIQWGIWGLGALCLLGGAEGLGITLMYVANPIYNVYRSVTYQRPGSQRAAIHGHFQNLNLAVLPDADGSFKAVALYRMEF
jgi:uncharacterized protein (TIGR02145 family)